MAFVRGHWRALGWVRSHRRRPQGPEHGQLPLPAATPAAAAVGSPTPSVVIPIPRAQAAAPSIRSPRR